MWKIWSGVRVSTITVMVHESKGLSKRGPKKVKATNIKTNEVITFNSTQEAKLKEFSGGCVSAACRGVYKGRAGKLVGGDGRTYRGYKWYYEAEENESK